MVQVDKLTAQVDSTNLTAQDDKVTEQVDKMMAQVDGTILMACCDKVTAQVDGAS
jgi:hypothetical protein